ncbi:MAG: PepSY domain-containing protein [Vicinamibacterales bacterium]
MTFIRKWLILSHRYAGIVLSALVMLWFASGIVMMYAGGLPRVTPALRLERMPDLDLTSVHLSAADATARLEAAGSTARAGRAQLLTVMNRPAYRVGTATVFADTGDVMAALTVDEARQVASRFMQVADDRVRFARTLTSVDQWTLGQGRGLPLHKFQVDDEGGTEIYVQPRTGEIATMTTRTSRALAWVGVIPHWLYFAALRANQPLWYQIVVWTSAAACAVTILGMVLGFTQFRKARPFRLAKAIPYAGWMRWHYITGVIFGTFTLTWAFSGLLSMEPFEWTNATGLEPPRDVFTGGPVDLAQFPLLEPTQWNQALNGRGIKEIEFARIQDEPYFIVHPTPLTSTEATRGERLHQPYGVAGRLEGDRVLVSARTLHPRTDRFSTASILERLKHAFPDEPIVVADLLTDYDSYYYSRGYQTPLPVLRVKFGDPAETWFYIDPAVSQVVAQVHRLNRVERWLYNGLHSLDFAFWYNSRPLWDIGMIVLLLGGLASSTIGLWLGLKRIRRGLVRA